MRRKCPRVGDIVRVPVEMDNLCVVMDTVGINLWVRRLDNKVQRNIHVRRDAVEIISRANSH